MDNNTISNILNIGADNVSKLAIFIFIIAGNYVNDTFSCDLRHLIRDNMIIKHIIGLFIVLIFVGLIQEKLTISNKFKLSLFLYIWYVFIMRSPIHITIIIIFIIIILYIIQEYINDLTQLLEDNSTDKKVDNADIQYKLYIFSYIQNILFILSVVLSIVGFSYYYLLSKQHSINFNLKDFLLGKSDARCFSK